MSAASTSNRRTTVIIKRTRTFPQVFRRPGYVPHHLVQDNDAGFLVALTSVNKTTETMASAAPQVTLLHPAGDGLPAVEEEDFHGV
jgi:hypothetical protein